MEPRSSNMSVLAPPVFDEENYQVSVVKMQAYMKGCEHWEPVKEDYEVTPLPNNPTINQIKMNNERTNEKAKAKACLYALISPAIFNRIMAFGSKKLQLKDSESIKEYSDKLIDITNKVRVLGTDLSNTRMVHKILVFVLEKYEATISSLEKTKDLTQLRVVELISSLQAQE
ncbi:uncharacterized protein [Gossypium hirsutum]|uniref:Uncharacterized protein n=1 Tax=Gossypium hirsutum TaxID=3635 RepID=A0A1U8IMB5_GOSHI|nr:uncharacterized protein LOC107898226 [Gossypium hirsutum]